MKFLLIIGLLICSAAASKEYQTSQHEGNTVTSMVVALSKHAMFKISVTLSDHTDTCPSSPEDIVSLQENINNALQALLQEAHVDAKFSTGVIGCEVISHPHKPAEVVINFVFKLNAKKGAGSMQKFFEDISYLGSAHRSLCSTRHLDCHALGIACVEVTQLAKKPHGIGLIKHIDSSTGSSTLAKHAAELWNAVTQGGTKVGGDRTAAYATDGTAENVDVYAAHIEGVGGQQDLNQPSEVGPGMQTSPSAQSTYMDSIPQEPEPSMPGTRVWPKLQVPGTHLGGAGGSPARHVVTNTNSLPVQHTDGDIERRLWPDYHPFDKATPSTNDAPLSTLQAVVTDGNLGNDPQLDERLGSTEDEQFINL